MDYTTEGMHISNNDDESSAVPAAPAVESNVVADSDMQQQQSSSSATAADLESVAPEAPLADHESDDDEPDAAPDAAEEEIVANDYQAVAAAAVVSDLPSQQSEAAGATAAADESAPSAENSETSTATAENVSNNPVLNEINDYSHQLYRIIMLCRRKIAANSQAHSTIIGLDAALARMPSNTMSLVNTMLEIFTSLIINVPNSQDMFDIETIREDLFRFYNLEHILASRCRRRSRRLASKRRRQHHSSS